MTATPPFDPPYKLRIAADGAEQWFEVLADGSQVACNAPAVVVPVATAASRPAFGASGGSSASGASSASRVTTLKVPYAEKDEAKQLGARWDPKRKKWYVPQGVDPAPFARWVDG